jgi:potassium efflux system protein
MTNAIHKAMAFFLNRTLTIVAAVTLLLILPAVAQESGVRVTVEQLQNRIKAAQDAADLEDTSRTRLLELYRQSINNIEAARANEEATEEFRRAQREAPRQTQKIRASIESRAATDPMASVGGAESMSTEELGPRLDEELANQTAVEAKLAVLEARLESEIARPTAARARISAARAQVAELARQAGETPPDGQSAQFTEANRWARSTRLQALQTEITMLDRELLSYNDRNDLLIAERDQQAQGLERIGRRVDALRELINERRRTEAERAIAQANAALEDATTDEPLLQELADANLKLVERLKDQVEQLDQLARSESSRPTTAQIEAAFRSARRKLELEPTSAPVGMPILEERSELPPLRELQSERRAISRANTAVSLRLLEGQETRRELQDLDAYLDRRLQEEGVAELDPTVRQELRDLVTTRRLLLDRTLSNDTTLQRNLYELDDALKRLIDRTTAYDNFLTERLLWVRSTQRVDAEQWRKLPGEVARYLSPPSWLETVQLALVRAIEAPIYLLLVIVAAILFFRSGAFRRALIQSGEKCGRIRDDSIRLTFQAIGYSVLIASPLPLFLGALGGGLASAQDGSVFATAIGEALVEIAVWVVFPLLVLVLFRGDGVAGRHFGWDQEVLKKVRRQLKLFVATAFPIYFVLITSNTTDDLTGSFGGVLTLVAFIALMVSLEWLILGLGHPTRGAVARVFVANPESRWWRWRYFWFPLAVLTPVVFAVLSYFGYDYTTQQLAGSLFESIWIITIIWLGAAVVRRWLLMTNRRLAYDKARAALEAARARRAGEDDTPEADEGDIGEPEIDLVALDADSRQLLNAFVLLLIVIGLAAVWGDIVPAIGILEGVSLWNKTALVNGVEQLVPVTLEDVVFAGLVGLGGYVLATNLPSLLNIILLKQGSVSAGGRYTVQTLTSYTITALAVVVVLSLLGVRASQLGWAAAALGVGIGFGLQEIVANFICGLILLFERPIRVGDIITAGDAEGVVSKIRIRATTIRDWEQKEMVIPNKELITGRLLNWTLTDTRTRITITVGVAYGSDTDKAMALMLEAADECPTVLKDPAPFVHFTEFADSTLNLQMRIFVGSTSERLASQSDVLTRIDRKFKDANITIAFPQRDIHVFMKDVQAGAVLEQGVASETGGQSGMSARRVSGDEPE